jgi:hypothetical protein
MMRSRLLLKAAPCVIVLALIISGIIFWLRAPVLLISDPSMNLLYGESRAALKQAEISLKLFRRLKTVLVSEDAGAEIIIAALNAAVKNPRAVLFPYRYAAAAYRYNEENPNIPAIILEGRGQVSKPPLGIATDTEVDLFRAGICAAFLAGENEGTILVFHDNTLTSGAMEAFEKGLLVQGSSKKPLYLEDFSDFSEEEDASCAVILGQGAGFFEENSNIPVILFSWIDPEMTPAYVKVIFCDSPWSQVYGALRIGNEETSLASELIIPGNRIPGKKELTRQLAALSGLFGNRK